MAGETAEGRLDADRAVDGVLLFDKPAGLTSNHALQRVKRLYGARRAGHAGTLDPLATGLLPILFGEATKFASALLDSDKEYLTTLRLGVCTDSGDAQGRVIEAREVDVSRMQVERILPRFRGALEQVPPMHSALKHKGQPLYKLARRGVEVARAPRPIRIDALELVSLEGDRLTLRVACSKGTYVRTLAADIGEALGSGAHVETLRRTRTGTWLVGDAATLETIESESAEERLRRLRPAAVLLDNLPRVELSAALEQRLRHGLELPPSGLQNGVHAVFGPGGRLVGTGVATGGRLRPDRLTADRPEASQAAEKA